MRKQHSDTKGRAYLKVADAKPGMIAECDGGFICVSEGTQVLIKTDAIGALWFTCRHEKHYLDGQLSDDCECYIGIYPVP